MITAFFFIHVYLTTTGHTMFAHIKAMITGWEDVDGHHKA
jgi:thiosulfate reductase cytochrome b subunit